MSLLSTRLRSHGRPAFVSRGFANCIKSGESVAYKKLSKPHPRSNRCRLLKPPLSEEPPTAFKTVKDLAGALRVSEVLISQRVANGAYLHYHYNKRQFPFYNETRPDRIYFLPEDFKDVIEGKYGKRHSFLKPLVLHKNPQYCQWIKSEYYRADLFTLNDAARITGESFAVVKNKVITGIYPHHHFLPRSRYQRKNTDPHIIYLTPEDLREIIKVSQGDTFP